MGLFGNFSQIADSSETQNPRGASLPLVAPHPPLRKLVWQNLVWHHLEKELAQKLVHRNLWKGLAQKFEISSCVLKLATKNVGTRNEKNVITEICVACAGKGSGTEICDTEICVEHVLAKILGQEMKDVICQLFHFLRRQANYFLIRWLYFGTI